MVLNALRSWCFFGIILGGGLFAQAENTLHVDFRNAHRNLITARQKIDVTAGPLRLWYPKWVPGTHGPYSPIQNLAGLKITTESGEVVPFHRESAEVRCFIVEVPQETGQLQIDFRYIANQMTDGSEGADVVANSELGYLNWNTCLLYPDGCDIDDWRITASLQTPSSWQVKSALAVVDTARDVIKFEETSLRDLVDRPVVMGLYTKTVRLDAADDLIPHFLHIVAPNSRLTNLPEELVLGYRELVKQAKLLFGRRPFDEYHFLLIVDDRLVEIGLEHACSSLNVLPTRDIFNSTRRIGYAVELLPHEYVHAWCGKFRRPRGMVQDNYHDDKRLNLLWVYEGLAEYIGSLLTVRSGLMTDHDFRESLAYRTHTLRMQKGRDWQTLEDTAVSAFLRRSASDNWAYLRRAQDYYDEGKHYWMEADAQIRILTEGQKSLDDFCRLFFGQESEQKILQFDEVSMYEALAEVTDFDWETFFHDRVKVTSSELSLTPLTRIGYKLDYASQQTAFQKNQENIYSLFDETPTLGVELSRAGRIEWVVPNSLADKAGITEGDTIAFVDGDRYSVGAFNYALSNKRGPKQLTFIIQSNGKHRLIEMDFDASLRYPRLTRMPDSEDLLSTILEPLSASIDRDMQTEAVLD